MIFRIFISLFSAILSSQCFANTQHLLRQLNLDDGLSQSSVTGLFEGHSGLKWLTTGNGIDIYNGNTIESWTGLSHELTNTYIINVKQLHNDKLWVSSSRGDLLRYDLNNNSTTKVFTVNRPNFISDFNELDEKNTLFSTKKKLYQYDENSSPSIYLDLESNLPDSHQINQFLVYKDNIVVATSLGVFVWHMPSNKLNYITEGAEKPAFKITVFQDFLLIGYQHELHAVPLNKMNLPEAAKVIDKQGKYTFAQNSEHLFVGTKRGIFRFNANTAVLKMAIRIRDLHPNIIAEYPISMMLCSTGLLWLGTLSDGVLIWNPLEKDFNHFIHSRKRKLSLSNNEIWSIIEDHKNPNSLWVGTADGLNKINLDTKKVRRYDSGSEDNQTFDYLSNLSMGYDFIYEVNQGNAGELYLSTNRGMIKYYPQNIGDERFELIELSTGVIMSTFKDEQNQLWMIVRDNEIGKTQLSRFDINTERFNVYPSAENILTNENPYQFILGYLFDDKNLVIASGTQLASFNTIRQETSEIYDFSHLASNAKEQKFIESAYFDADKNTLWLAVVGYGLIAFDMETKTIQQRLHHSHYGFDKHVYQLQPDDHKRLWFSSHKGLFFMDLETLYINSFTTHHGLFTNEFNARASTRLKNGKLAYGSMSGVTVFDPSNESFHKPHIRPNLLLTAFDHPSLSLPPHNLAKLKSTSIDVPYDHQPIKLLFADAAAIDPTLSLFRYQLHGESPKTFSETNEHWITLSNLSWGQHQLVVHAVSPISGELSEPFTLNIRVQRPPWLTNTAIVFYFGLTSLLLWLVWMYSTHAILVKNRQIKQLVKQKTRELEASNSKLQDVVKELKTANTVKDRFLANMSHEMRTPLTTIMGYTQSVLDGNFEKNKKKDALSLILSSSYHLLNIINDLLDLTRLKQDKFVLNIETHNLKETFRELLSHMSLLVDKKGLSINHFFDTNVPECINTDITRLHQVLINIIDNAIKFTDSGFIQIDVKKDNQMLIIDIIDTGIGIDDQQSVELLDAFTQANNTFNRKQSGIGLGLHISHQIITALNGSISLKRNAHDGTTVTVRHPIGQTQSMAEAVSKAAPAQQTHLTLKGMHLLVADDFDSTIELIRLIMKKYGVKVTGAKNGAEALEKLREDKSIDLVLMDIQMPIMDGIRALQELRQWDTDTPVFAFTANNMQHEIEQYLSQGFAQCIKKPIDRHELITCLKHAKLKR